MRQPSEGLSEEGATSLQLHVHTGNKAITNDVKVDRKYTALKTSNAFQVNTFAFSYSI